MKVLKAVPCALVAAMLLTACLQRSFTEETSNMSALEDELVAPGDVIEGIDLVKDTLFVKANRSWSATFLDDVDWVVMDTLGSQNMERATKVSPLVFSFKDNNGKETRNVKVRISSADDEMTVTLSQLPAVPRLSVEALSPLDSLSSDGATVELKVSSNKAWTAEFADGSTANAELEKSEGYRNEVIKINVGENEDASAKKTGKVLFTAEGCEPVVISFKQLEGVPYFELLSPAEYQAIEGVANYKINFNTNARWIAEIVKVEGMKNYDYSKIGFANPFSDNPAEQVRKKEGKKSETSITVYFPGNSDFDSESSIVVKMTADKLDSAYYVTIKQKPCITMCFHNHSDDVKTAGSKFGLGQTYWPLTDIRCNGSSVYGTDLAYNRQTGYAAVPTSGGSAILRAVEAELVVKSGHAFKFYSTGGIYKNSLNGFCGWTSPGDYLEMPVVEGKRLSSIVYIHRGTGVSEFSIQTPDGKELKHVSVGGQGTEATFDLEGSEIGKAYRLVNVSGGLRIGDLILYYK